MGQAELGDSDVPEGDRLYDAYLEACLRGTAPSAKTYLADHAVSDDALERRLERLHGMMTAATDREVPFERLGDYRLLERLGEGGMGAVYVAMQERLGRKVALKIIRPELQTSAKARVRFEREARSVARLRHPSIVRVHDFGVDQGVSYCAMELLSGRALSALLEESLPSPALAAGWCRDLALALAYAHEQGIVHRDVKPSNVFIQDGGVPVLLDFGIAHLMEVEGTRLTSTFAGSPSYAAPEQISVEYGRVDGRTDVYGLGATFYECLTGHPPFEGGTAQSVFRRVLVGDPVPPRRLRPSLPVAHEHVTMKALEKRPADRYASAMAFSEDLQALCDEAHVRARAPGPVRRLRKWTRRHPYRAGVSATLLVAALILPIVLTIQGWRAARERHDRARRLLAQARGRVEAFREKRVATERSEASTRHREAQRVARYFTDEEDRELERALRVARAFRREREAIYYEVLELLQRAERLDPELQGATEVIARLHAEKILEARAQGDVEAATLYESILRRHDPQGRWTSHLHQTGLLQIHVDPADVETHLFASREQSELLPEGERRLVPVAPAEAGEAVRPGTWGLRVLDPAGSLRAGDVVVRVAGHPVRGSVLLAEAWGDARIGDRLIAVVDASRAEHPVRSVWQVRESAPRARALVFERDGRRLSVPVVAEEETGKLPALVCPGELVRRGAVALDAWSGGRLVSCQAPSGLRVRTTAAPRFLSPASRRDPLPPEGVALTAGPYELVLTARGRAMLAFGMHVKARTTWRILGRLPDALDDGHGWVYVPDVLHPDPDLTTVLVDRGFWMQEHEVTCEAYLPFLNDPRTLAEVDEAAREGRSVRVPRELMDGGEGTTWPRDASGRYRIGRGRHPRWPVTGVSFEDARAYVRWRSHRDGRAYALPTRAQWDTVAYGSHRGDFVFGRVFRPKWVKSCFGRPRPCLEPVMSYPVDQTVHGVFDLSGSASEWLDAWYWEERGLRRLAGGAWVYARPERFAIEGALGMGPETAGPATGFRLVLPVEASE